jgi:hypothetical protein
VIEFETTVRVACPASRVFAFLSRFENLPKWNYFVLDVAQTTPGPVGIGTTYHQVRKTDEQDFSVTEFEPGRKVAVKTLPGSSPQLEMQFTLQADGSATVIRDRWRLDTGKPVLIEKLGVGQIKSAVTQNLLKLKELLEAGRVTLQDGRQVTI